MEAINSLGKWLAILGIGVASLFALSGWWLTKNADVVADAAVEASGVKERMARIDQIKCEEVRRTFHDSWDSAVNSGTLAKRQESLDRQQDRMNDFCGE